MAKQNLRENRNYLEDMSQLIAEIDNLKPEPEICNVSCPPFGYPLGPCPGMCCDNNICNPCCVSKIPKNSQSTYVQPSPLPYELLFSNNLRDASTSTCDFPSKNTHTCSSVPAQICYPAVVPQPNATMEIQESAEFTPRFYNYHGRKPFLSFCPSNGEQNYLQHCPPLFSQPYQTSTNSQQYYPQPSSSSYLVSIPLRRAPENGRR